MEGTSYLRAELLQTAANLDWKLCGSADFNSDGRADLIWRNAANGKNGIWFMKGTLLLSVEMLTTVTDPGWKIVN